MKSKLALMILPLAIFAFSAQARSTNAEAAKEAQQVKKDDIQARKDEKAEEKQNRFCNRVEAKVQNRVKVFENHQLRRVNRHRRIVKRLTSLADNLDEKGLNTTQLRTHLREYAGKIDDYEAEFDTFIEELATSEDYTCNESEGKFVTQIKQARIQLGITRQKRAEIWQYYDQVIKKDLETLKSQLEE